MSSPREVKNLIMAYYVIHAPSHSETLNYGRLMQQVMP